MASVEASGLEAARPRRIGTAINSLGPVWRSENALHSFARQNDGTLGLRSIDSNTGATHDLGVRLPASTGQGAGLAARWDTRHGYALLLSQTIERRNRRVITPGLAGVFPAAELNARRIALRGI